jgi:hypothetical protein
VLPGGEGEENQGLGAEGFNFTPEEKGDDEGWEMIKRDEDFKMHEDETLASIRVSAFSCRHPTSLNTGY